MLADIVLVFIAGRSMSTWMPLLLVLEEVDEPPMSDVAHSWHTSCLVRRSAAARATAGEMTTVLGTLWCDVKDVKVLTLGPWVGLRSYVP
mmetsp:Transcript_13068/g.33506  ORF Transcript_13068/g.33506 Transcript_13068/m.33506 type:complete len:90 (+) Transcript_13068:844-1113(+)